MKRKIKIPICFGNQDAIDKNKRGEPMKCAVCKHNLVYSEADKIFYCPKCGQKYD